MKKRLLAILACVTMIFTCYPVSVLAGEEIPSEIGYCEEETNPDLEDKPGDVVEEPLPYSDSFYSEEKETDENKEEEDNIFFVQDDEEELSAESGSSYPASYDPRDYNAVTSVKNQGDSTCCTLFATTSTMESYLIKKGYANNSIDLSEIYLGIINFDNGEVLSEELVKQLGSYTNALQIFVNNKLALCAVPESVIPTPNMATHFGSYTVNKPQGLSERTDTYVCKECNYNYDISSQNEVKEMILNYGGVEVYINSGGNIIENINQLHDGLMINADGNGHAVELVGWDDNIPCGYFNNNYTKNGAWLCKNSYGTSSTNSGFFWISYCDIPFFTEGWTYELIPSGSYVSNITIPQTEVSLYVGQSTDPIVPTITPSTATNKNYTISLGDYTDRLKLNSDNSVTVLKSFKPTFGGNPTAYVRVKPEDTTCDTAMATLKINILANTVKCDNPVMIPDSSAGQINGVSTYPVEGRENTITYSSSYLTITDNNVEVIKDTTPYGSFNIKAKLDEKDNQVPVCVYCTQMNLGDDLNVNGEGEQYLTVQFPLSNNLEAFKGKLVVNSTSPDILSAEADGANLTLTPHKNGKVAVTAYLKDNALTNGETITDSIYVTVTGIGSDEPVIQDPNPSGTDINEDPYQQPVNPSTAVTTPAKSPQLRQQTIELKRTKYSYKSKQLKKKAKKFKIKAVYNNGSSHGAVSFKIAKYPKGGKKYIKVDKKGNVTLKKNAKKGIYKIRISLAGTSNICPASATITIKVK